MEIKAPKKYNKADYEVVVFLAGSIEMGKAENWQTRITKAIDADNVLVLNPRRDEWNSSWQQTIKDKQFRTQVEWELQGLDDSTILVVYFDPATQSPITLMELGLHAADGKLLVCCPEGFWRKGNIEVVCNKYKIPLFDTYDDLLEALTKEIATKSKATKYTTLQKLK